MHLVVPYLLVKQTIYPTSVWTLGNEVSAYQIGFPLESLLIVPSVLVKALLAEIAYPIPTKVLRANLFSSSSSHISYSTARWMTPGDETLLKSLWSMETKPIGVLDPLFVANDLILKRVNVPPPLHFPWQWPKKVKRAVAYIDSVFDSSSVESSVAKIRLKNNSDKISFCI